MHLPCDALRLPDTIYHDLNSYPPELSDEPPPAWLLRDGLEQTRLRSRPKWNAPAVTIKTVTKGSVLSMKRGVAWIIASEHGAETPAGAWALDVRRAAREHGAR